MVLSQKEGAEEGVSEVKNMVNAEILYEDDEKIKILLKETDRAFVNSIRRTLMSDTPKMAIETVRFVKKTEEEDGGLWETDGPLPDEVIAQRLATVSLYTSDAADE